MESTVLPLELAFEHRNYLASIGPIFAIGWWLSTPSRPSARRILLAAAVLLVLALASLTHLRALDWSDRDRLVLSEVRHHPESPRANFRIAQILMDQLGKTDDPQTVYRAARYHLETVRRLDPANHNPLFGLIYLELIVNRDPPAELVDTLVEQLRHGVFGAEKIAISQFSYLVRWQLAEGTRKLPHAQALAILNAAVDNPRIDQQAKAAVFSALRAYHDRVLDDPATALPFARQAAQTWWPRWHYHYRLVQLLLRLGQHEEAQQAYQRALRIPSSRLHPEQVNELQAALILTTPSHD
jgi:tetratricopeptide (TPR) repeat protein